MPGEGSSQHLLHPGIVEPQSRRLLPSQDGGPAPRATVVVRHRQRELRAALVFHRQLLPPHHHTLALVVVESQHNGPVGL